jgi:hypothetical protein
VTLRGRHKEAAILALAKGDETHEQIAERYGISTQAVNQFSVRHRDAVQAVIAEGRSSLAGMWSADRRQKLGELERLYEDCELELEGDGTDHYKHKTRLLMVRILHDMAELAGDLTVRTRTELDAPSLAAFAGLVRGEDGNLYGVRDTATGQVERQYALLYRYGDKGEHACYVNTDHGVCETVMVEAGGSVYSDEIGGLCGPGMRGACNQCPPPEQTFDRTRMSATPTPSMMKSVPPRFAGRAK